MSIYFGGKKVKEVYWAGRKVKEAWYMGKRIHNAFKLRVITVTMDPAGVFMPPMWDTGSVAGDDTLVRSISGDGLYLAANATYTRTGGGGGLRYADSGESIAVGDMVRAGHRLVADPGTYVFTETRRKLVEVMPVTIEKWDAQNWLRSTLAGYGQDYKTVTELPFDIDSRNATDMSGMFDGCLSLTAVPQMDTRNVTNMGTMFILCSALTVVPEMNTSRVTDMGFMFYGCSSLTAVPQMNTSQVTNMKLMFNDCHSLTAVPQMDTRNVTKMGAMFQRCSSLRTVPQMNTSRVTDMGFMFYGCSSLTAVPQMDTSRVTRFVQTFSQCRALTDENVALTIKRRGADTTDMIAKSGLTREPFLTIE
ncbi:BspA family leucine-rich repeat surface protein [Corynebacterium macclintockiae]|uniref:BspA family leucine-rich repeat surface protein n=1 Tax=Corynebacterium macclintockiae TaxID=2913501 RepID=UPI003EC06D92